MDSPIATTTFDVRLPSGAVKQIRVEIGAPKQCEGHAECQVFVSELDDRIRTIYGADTLQALVLALRFVRNEVESAVEDWQWTIESDGQPFPEWRCMFGDSTDRRESAS